MYPGDNSLIYKMVDGTLLKIVTVLNGLVLLVTCSVTVHEVDRGDMAVLLCNSNDEGHRFQYWQTNDDQIIGPGNDNYNKHKYKFEVWSGTLYIKSVSSKDSGFYRCFSRQLGGTGLNIEVIELIVKKDWEQVWEEDPNVNSYRAAIGVLVFLILVLLGVFGFIMKRRKAKGFLVMSEDSPSTTPTRTVPRGAYNETTAPKPTTSSGEGRGRSPFPAANLMDSVIDTDIKSSFQLRDNY